MLRLLKMAKGDTLNRTAHSVVGYYLKKKKIGELKSFTIDMSSKKLSIAFIPKNFSEVLSIEAVNYNIVTDPIVSKSYLTFDSISTSKNWDDKNFKELIKNKRIEVPAKYSKLLSMIA